MLEFGEGLPGQDELVACAFGLGAGGRGGAGDAAGSVARIAGYPDAERRGVAALPDASTAHVRRMPTQTPMVSVVICAYNAERTMRPCLESLRRLDYPNFEVDHR